MIKTTLMYTLPLISLHIVDEKCLILVSIGYLFDGICPGSLFQRLNGQCNLPIVQLESTMPLRFVKSEQNP